MHEEVPERARIGLYHIVEQAFGGQHSTYLDLYKAICVALRIPLSRRIYEEYKASEAVEAQISTCNWWQFYDICEVMLKKAEYSRGALSSQINTLFAEEHLGFEIRNGIVEKVGSGFIDARIKEARYLLKEPEFKGADYLFEKALKAINVRLDPDVENCVKDAVAAIESVGRIIANDGNALLSNIIKDMSKTGVIPKPLDEAIQKVYAYRGNEPGVSHGLVGDPRVTVDEAEFVLAMSAAIIVYLVKKREDMHKASL